MRGTSSPDEHWFSSFVHSSMKPTKCSTTLNREQSGECLNLFRTLCLFAGMDSATKVCTGALLLFVILMIFGSGITAILLARELAVHPFRYSENVQIMIDRNNLKAGMCEIKSQFLQQNAMNQSRVVFLVQINDTDIITGCGIVGSPMKSKGIRNCLEDSLEDSKKYSVGETVRCLYPPQLDKYPPSWSSSRFAYLEVEKKDLKENQREFNRLYFASKNLPKFKEIINLLFQRYC